MSTWRIVRSRVARVARFCATNDSVPSSVGLLVVIVLAGYLGPPTYSPAGSEAEPVITKLAERPGIAQGIASSRDGSVFMTFRGEEELFRLDAKTREVQAVNTVHNPRAVVSDGNGGAYVAYSVDPGYGDVFHTALGLVTQTGVAEVLRVPSNISAMATDGHGTIFAAAGEIWKVTPDGRKTLMVGTELEGEAVRYLLPVGVAVNARGQVLVVDDRHTVFLVEGGKIRQLAGRVGECDFADGVGDSARFCGPAAAVADIDGSFLVVDQDCAVRRVTAEGRVTTVIGLLDRGPKGVVQLPEEECRPWVRSIAIDSNGDILLAARSALRVRLRSLADNGKWNLHVKER